MRKEECQEKVIQIGIFQT